MTRKTVFIGMIATIVVTFNIFFGGCINQPVTDSFVGEEDQIRSFADDSMATSQGVASVVYANNQFAFELYLQYKDKEDNIFFSPYSISVALAMTYEGARGQTASEMQSVLHFPEEDITRRAAFARLYNEYNIDNTDYILSTANALWTQEDYKFLTDYLNIIEQYYMGKTTDLDFKGEPEESRETINNWVEERTNDKIQDLIPPGVINELTRLVLTNAIYFKGDWATQFDEENTQEADFRVSSEKTVKVQMMGLSGESFNYTATDIAQIIELPYKGDDLSMLILLPTEDNLDSLEESLSAESLNQLRSELRETEIEVYMPKFKLETKYFMSDTLKEMGMLTAFSEAQADFSGMNGKKDLYITSVIHQGFIEVNEKGTEAAAATAVTIGTYSGPPTFYADHPFIFLVQDKETGNILFIGRVVDPTL
ncbi:MAG: serpin family protein [Thermoplasmata archaeon]|nr:MAG: serpin family protein [Thermoplasmata archaeon]